MYLLVMVIIVALRQCRVDAVPIEVEHFSLKTNAIALRRSAKHFLILFPHIVSFSAAREQVILFLVNVPIIHLSRLSRLFPTFVNRCLQTRFASVNSFLASIQPCQTTTTVLKWHPALYRYDAARYVGTI